MHKDKKIIAIFITLIGLIIFIIGIILYLNPKNNYLLSKAEMDNLSMTLKQLESLPDFFYVPPVDKFLYNYYYIPFIILNSGFFLVISGLLMYSMTLFNFANCLNKMFLYGSIVLFLISSILIFYGNLGHYGYFDKLLLLGYNIFPSGLNEIIYTGILALVMSLILFFYFIFFNRKSFKK